VRIPAAAWGVDGCKPACDPESRAGVTPLCAEFDVVGVIARRIDDLAVAAATLGMRADEQRAPASRLRLAAPRRSALDASAPILDAFDAALARCEAAGLDVTRRPVGALAPRLADMDLAMTAQAADAQADRLAGRGLEGGHCQDGTSTWVKHPQITHKEGEAHGGITALSWADATRIRGSAPEVAPAAKVMCV